jgi:hypothetical protein
MKRLATTLIVLVSAVCLSGQGASKWVYVGVDQGLHYGTDARGNRIMDFAHAGYKGGGIAQLRDRLGETAVENLGYRGSTSLRQTLQIQRN